MLHLLKLEYHNKLCAQRKLLYCVLTGNQLSSICQNNRLENLLIIMLSPQFHVVNCPISDHRKMEGKIVKKGKKLSQKL